MLTVTSIPWIVWASVSVTLSAAGQLLIKSAVNSASSNAYLPLQLGYSLLTSPALWLGLLCYGISMVLWLFTLSLVDLTVAYPFVSIGFVAVLVGSSIWLREPVTPGRVVGALLVTLGVILSARG